MNKIIVIAGPTASGKTSLSIKVCKTLGGEVVSADSMQIYKTLDIGTAKPSREERCGIAHHMMDVCDPWTRYSVAEYVSEATKAIDGIIARGNVPVVVGGTGLYIDHLLYDTDFAEGFSDEALRTELGAIASEKGGSYLKNMLSEFDPESAERLHDNDVKRIIRAIEFYKTSGKTISEHNKSNCFQKKRYDAKFYVLNSEDRSYLYDRINMRVDLMMQEGLLEEARRVVSSDWFGLSTAAQAIGYKEFVPYFKNAESLDSCVELLKQHSRNYAKRQLTWFRAKKNAEFLDILNKGVDPLDKIISDWQGDN